MTDKPKISPYEYFRSYDIVGMLAPLLDGGNHYLRQKDGKAKAKVISLARDNPWVHVGHLQKNDCGLWNQLTFKGIVPNLPSGRRFVPRGCHECWKVCVKPRTLQQLFNLHEVQKKLHRPAKCGIELRPSVPALYGGYFYNASLDEGLECYDIVKNEILKNDYLAPLVDEVDVHGKTTRIILKRACTEFEHMFGDSTKWKITPEQEFIEDLIADYVVSENFKIPQPDHLKWNVKRRWIEWAWQNGDPTYALYTDGKPLYPSYVTYHQPELLVPPRDEILFRKF